MGYVYKGAPRHWRLLKGAAATAVGIDYSFNEINQLAQAPIMNKDQELCDHAVGMIECARLQIPAVLVAEVILNLTFPRQVTL